MSSYYGSYTNRANQGNTRNLPYSGHQGAFSGCKAKEDMIIFSPECSLNVQNQGRFPYFQN